MAERVAAPFDDERWPMRSLLLQLMQDYVDGKIAPTTEAPPVDDETRDPGVRTFASGYVKAWPDAEPVSREN